MLAGASRRAFPPSLGFAAGYRLATSRYAATKPRIRPSTVTFSSAARRQVMDIDDRMNEGLILQHQLQEAGHEKWGLAIFRCTYADDAAWRRFMAIVNARTRASLEYYGTPKLLHSLEWSVQEDPSSLDGASTDVVRRRFAEWVAGAMRREANASRGFATRFQYCLHVDAAALKSVVQDAPQPPDPDLGNVGYVNVVDLDWEEEPVPEEVGYLEDEPEIEGKRPFDVGFMRVPVDGLAPWAYSMLAESGGWQICYVRPPGIVEP